MLPRGAARGMPTSGRGLRAVLVALALVATMLPGVATPAAADVAHDPMIPTPALTSLTASTAHTCGLAADGTAWCWGHGTNGQLGNNDTSNHNSPVAVDMTPIPGGTLTSLTAGVYHTCGLAADGTAWCWGYNYDGQLGNNATTDYEDSPVAVDMTAIPGNTLSSLTAGGLHTCGLAADGTGWCWGYNYDGELGNNATSNEDSPVAVDMTSVPGGTLTSLTAGTAHTCGLAADGTAWCWGDGEFGQLGNNATPDTQSSPVAVDMTATPDGTLTALTAGDTHTCGLAANGTAWCWGNGYNGQLGNNATPVTQSSPVPVDMTAIPGNTLTALTAGYGHTCGLAADGTAWCWGYGGSGQLGNNDTTNQDSPVAVDMTAIPGGTLTSLTAGGYHTCGLAADGTAWCWGYGGNGQLGNNATTNQDSPVAVDMTAIGGGTLTDLTAGINHTCGLAADGTAWCWGQGTDGQLGNIATTNHDSPVPVDMTAIGGNTLTDLTAGGYHTCGLAADGTAWCWGMGSFGQLGNNATIDQISPVAVDLTAVPGGTLTSLTAGGFHTCGLAADGTAWCWGDGDEGQLGNNATTDQDSPVPVDTTSTPGGTLTSLSAGGFHTCALAADGTAWCWGMGSSGQLGNNATIDQVSPVAVDMTAIPGGTLTSLSAGVATTCGLAADGTAWCWGQGIFGELGNGDTTDQSSPVAVDVSVAVAVADVVGDIGDEATFIATTDGVGPASFQWSRDGVEIPGATDPTLQRTLVAGDHDAVFAVTVTNALSATASDTATVSSIPTADAGGPYTVGHGGTVMLDATGSSDDDGDVLTFVWDLDDDGTFGETGTDATHGDEVGATPTFDATGLAGSTTVPVTVRVDDGTTTVTDTTTVEIGPVAPTITFDGDAADGAVTTTEDVPVTVTVTVTPTEATVGWDLDGDGTFDDATGTTIDLTYPDQGVFAVTVRADNAGLTADARLSVVVRDTTTAATRVAGDSRTLTAIATSRDTFADGAADAVVLARADVFADALAGTALAVRANAPLLLTPTSHLPDAVLVEIDRVLTDGGTVYLLGGTNALSDDVAAPLADRPVTRLFGPDRYATATAIADEAVRLTGAPDTILIARGDDFPDGLAAGAIAAAVDGVVVLTAGDRPTTPTDTFLATHPTADQVAVGGPAASAYPAAEPIVGGDRHATAVALAEHFLTDPVVVGIARGDDFPDAMTGGVHVGRLGGALLLTRPATLPAATHGYLCTNAGSLDVAYAYGGAGAIHQTIVSALEDAVTSTGC